MIYIAAGELHRGRWRGHRGRGFGGRVCDYRRIRARDSRSGRRPIGRHRRDQSYVRLDQGEDHRRSRRDLSRPHDRAGRRRDAAEDAQRDRAQYSAVRTYDHFHAGRSYAAAVRHLCQGDADRLVLVALLVCLIPTTIGGLLSAIGIAGMDRLVQTTCWPCAGARWKRPATSIRCCWTKPAPSRWAIARRRNSFPGDGSSKRLADAAQLSSLADETPEGRSSSSWPRQVQLARPRPGRHGGGLCSVHRADAHERRGLRGANPQRRAGRGREFPGGPGHAPPNDCAGSWRRLHSRWNAAGGGGRLDALGVIYLKDIVKGGIRERLSDCAPWASAPS